MLQELKARPVVLLLGGLLIGIGLSKISWLFFIGIGLGYIFKKPWIMTLCFGAYVAGFLVIWRKPPEVLPAGDIHTRVVIHSFPNFIGKKCLYNFETVDGERYQGVLRVDPLPVLSPYSIVEVEGTANETITGSLSPDHMRVISSWKILDWLVDDQLRAIDRTNQLFGKEDGSWVTALTFNFPSDLTAQEKNDLRFNGTYHMVSASGLHVFVVAFMLHFLLVGLGMQRHWQLLTVFLLLLAYCAITGFHAPTLRASLMWLIGSAAYLFRRSPDGLSALSLSALIWLFFGPDDAFNAGFQLSYITSGCLILWFERKRLEEQGAGRSLLEASVVATIAAEPLSAWWFGQIIFIGPISNLLIEFPSSAVMIFGFLCLIPVVGQVFVYIAKPMIWWMKLVTIYTAKFPMLLVHRYTLPPWVYVLYYLFLLWLLLGRPFSLRDPMKKE